MHHGDLCPVVKGTDDLIDGKGTALNLLDLTCIAVWRDHYLVNDVGLLNFSDDSSGSNHVACFLDRLELPLLIMGETGSSNSTLDEISHLLNQHFERPLNTVVNTGQKSWSQLNGERETGVLYRFTRLDA